jgi:hypothetical protein
VKDFQTWQIEDMETWQVDQGGTNHMDAKPLGWSGMFIMITSKKPGQVGRMYHSRGQRKLQCCTWASLTLIGCDQDLVTSNIARPSVRVI